MKPSCQYVYALTSNGDDIYLYMTQLSVKSLRLHNENSKIILVCDSQTHFALKKSPRAGLGEYDHIIAIETPEGSGIFRNRYLKTTLRNHLSEPFLYLDADTLIRGDLSPIFDLDVDFSAAPNHSGSGDPADMPCDELENFTLLDWNIPEKYYVNGGVLFFNDTPKAAELSSCWHKKWLETGKKLKRHRDQPSLNSALADTNPTFTWLNSIYNAQIEANPLTTKKALLWHIYSSSGSYALTTHTRFYKFVNTSANGEEITLQQLKSLCQSPHPWMIQSFIDWWCVQRIISVPGLAHTNSFEHLWIAHNYQSAKFLLKQNLKNRFKILYKGYVFLPGSIRMLFKKITKIVYEAFIAQDK